MSLPVEHLQQCWFLAGPTASGKTAASIVLAERLNAEIVSMDSMAIYRRMDIGTAKPMPAERRDVVHHLIDIIDPHEEFSVSEYVNHASQAVNAILQRGRIPLFVGGTGLYLRSLLRGVFDGPEAHWDLRRQLQAEAESRGNEWLHGELQKVDATTAQRLHPNDQRRVIRAIEVYRLTGQPLSVLQQQQSLPADQRPAVVVWMEPPRDWLHFRVDRRVDVMMEQGLLRETEDLLNSKPAPGRTARQALGYRELIEHLESGSSLNAMVNQIKTATRQFAKRQHTWFRNLTECTSLKITGQESPDQLADRVSALAVH